MSQNTENQTNQKYNIGERFGYNILKSTRDELSHGAPKDVGQVVTDASLAMAAIIGAAINLVASWFNQKKH